MSCPGWEQHSIASERAPQHSTGAGCSVPCSLPLCAACHAGRAGGTQGEGTLQAAETERAVCSRTWTVGRVWERDLSGSHCRITSSGCSQGVSVGPGCCGTCRGVRVPSMPGGAPNLALPSQHPLLLCGPRPGGKLGWKIGLLKTLSPTALLHMPLMQQIFPEMPFPK